MPSNKKKRTGLKDRLDVVNKSILRGMRKFFISGFRASQESRKLKGGPNRSKLFQEAVSNYVKTLDTHAIWSINESAGSSSEYIQILNDIVGGFVCQIKYSKSSKYSNIAISPRVKKFMNKFDKCWRFYSHTLFYELEKVNKYEESN